MSGWTTMVLPDYLGVGEAAMLTLRWLSCNPERTLKNSRKSQNPGRMLNAICQF